MASRESTDARVLLPSTPTLPGPHSARQAAAASPVAPLEVIPTDEHRENFVFRALKGAPPWLVSAILHMLGMIAMALLLLPRAFDVRIDLEATFADSLGDQPLIDSPFFNPLTDEVDDPILTPEDLLDVLGPAVDPEALTVELPGQDPFADRAATMAGVAYKGRRPGSKASLLGTYGGNAQTQRAVLAGLEWLARNQQKNGSWSLRGPYSAGGSRENREAATAMALLAFQGDGHTAEYGEYQEVVRRGWYYLLREQDAKGCFYREKHRIHHNYTQGLATIAVCEHYAMLSDPMLKAHYREPAEKAVKYCVEGQSSDGGWRYQPRTDCDLSVTGWIVMALQSARMAGLDVPRTTLLETNRYLDSVQEPNGCRYCYTPGSPPSCAMTAEGLLCRQYLGWDRDNASLLDAVEWLLLPENEISYTKNRDVYYWYYATQVMHHMEGEAWHRWNARMRELVPQAQVREGREAGSWDPQKPTEDRRAGEGGRLYVTCLSLYMLQVYYRHLPLYANPFDFLQPW